MSYIGISKDILCNGIYYRLVKKKNRKSFSIFFSAENVEEFNKIGAEKIC